VPDPREPIDAIAAACEVLAERLYSRHFFETYDGQPRWAEESEPHKETWREIARVDLEALSQEGLKVVRDDGHTSEGGDDGAT
jgi:hypothetical protein